MKKHLPTIILTVVFLAGLSLLLYPTVSDWWNASHQTQAIVDYAQNVDNISKEKYEKMLAEAHAYNETLFATGNTFKLDEKEQIVYDSILAIDSTGMIGYIEIPTLNVSLPIYHGTSDAVLSVGVGHIEGSAFPVGGESTHAVLSGHRGLPSAKLFTNIDRLVEGDYFVIRILNETLTYEVDQIRIVLPDEVDDLAVVEGMDYCTLVTCTPYGVNSHRLLVRGHRTENISNAGDIKITSDALQIAPVIIAPIIAAPILLVLVMALIINSNVRKKKKRQKTVL